MTFCPNFSMVLYACFSGTVNFLEFNYRKQDLINEGELRVSTDRIILMRPIPDTASVVLATDHS
jgi:hypothetical protein